MSVGYFIHDSFFHHDTGYGHPERIARIETIQREVEAARIDGLVQLEAPVCPRDSLILAHPADYVDAIIDAVPTDGLVAVDGDTILSPRSGDAALRAAGAVVAAVDQVVAGDLDRAFCAVRPPGHHAEQARAMGFCFFSNIAIGAIHAIANKGLSRIAILDFDVHHGNGTQDLVETREDIFFASTHQWPLFPGTGARHERGVGNVINRPLSAGTTGEQWRAVVEADILPALDAFAPDLVMISAGFDAHRADPLGGMLLVEEDFAWITRQLDDIARRHAGGRIVSVLEGGYDVDATADSAVAHIETMMPKRERSETDR